MRRIGGIWPEVVSFNNLLRATKAAARGKRQVNGVARFLERLEPEALRLRLRAKPATAMPRELASPGQTHPPREHRPSRLVWCQ